MERRYNREVLTRLFAKSGNQCAFPGCKEKLYMDDVYVGNKCHIEAIGERGPRYNIKRLEDGTVNDESNLILLCYKHHKLVDDKPDTYTPDVLKSIKAQHEAEVDRKMRGEGDERNERNEREVFYRELRLIFQKHHFQKIFSVQSFDVPYDDVDYWDVKYGYDEIRLLMEEPCARSISDESYQELSAYADALESLISHISQYCRLNGNGMGVKKREDDDISEEEEITHKMMEELAHQYRKFRFDN